MSAAFDYWASAGLDQITPQGLAWPEGDDFPRFLADLIGPRRVLEFGCGPGRLAPCFDAGRYIGIDICAAAIDAAKTANGGHDFRLIGADDPLPEAEIILCHTVLLHVPDEDLAGTIGRFAAPVVLISEILGRHWRRPGDPPVFNRDGIDYALAMGTNGYGVMAMIERPYTRYQNTNLSILEFRRDRSLRDAPATTRPRRARS